MLTDNMMGPYELIRSIGRGGMAEVWLARPAADPSRYVVVKTVLPHLVDEPESLRLFAAEARICGLFDHPNIVQLIDHCQEGPTPYLAMELVDGISLRELIEARRKRGHALPCDVSMHIGRSVCAALQEAHGHPSGEILHRDISPENVMLSRSGQVKVLDFGLASGGHDSRHLTRMPLGKLQYVAPEQLMGQREDARTDLYATGVMLYECLTGAQPFPATAEVRVMTMIVEGHARPPRSIEPSLSDEVDAVLKKAMANTPGDRFRSAAELAAALDCCPGTADARDALATLVSENLEEREQHAEFNRNAKANRTGPHRALLEDAKPSERPKRPTGWQAAAETARKRWKERRSSHKPRLGGTSPGLSVVSTGPDGLSAADAHFMAGLEHLRRGERALALEEWTLAAQLAPGNELFQQNIARLRRG